MSLSHAATLLEIFRNTFTNNFPFVVISSASSVDILRSENPFLLLSIMAATSFKDVRLQRALGREIKKEICERIIMGHQVSMDLLQGLLVYVA